MGNPSFGLIAKLEEVVYLLHAIPPIAKCAMDGAHRFLRQLADELVDFFAVGVKECKDKGHLAEGVGGAAQAWVEGTDYGFDTV